MAAILSRVRSPISSTYVSYDVSIVNILDKIVCIMDEFLLYYLLQKLIET